MAITFMLGSAEADRAFGVECVLCAFGALLAAFVVTSVWRAFRTAKPARRRR